MVNFKEPLPSKLLRSSTQEIVLKAQELQFNTVEQAHSNVANIIFSANAALDELPAQVPTNQNGHVLRRVENGAIIEELGLRDGRFGYVSTVYGRWENLRERLDNTLMPPLAAVSAAVDIEAIKLEYWDSFWFDGDKEQADASELIHEFHPALPKNAISGGSLWHSHHGWFEGDPEMPILVHLNLDSVDRTNKETKDTKRFLGIYTLLEQRSGNRGIEIEGIAEHLDLLHKRSVTILGKTLNADIRAQIGIDLEDYK